MSKIIFAIVFMIVSIAGTSKAKESNANTLYGRISTGLLSRGDQLWTAFSRGDVSEDTIKFVGYGISSSVAIGYYLKDIIRVEGEISREADTIDTDGGGTVGSYLYMINGLYDIKLTEKLYPYIGIGFGRKTGNVLIGYDVRGSAFTYQAKIGISYIKSYDTRFVIGYSYMAVGETTVNRILDIEKVTLSDNLVHNIEIGIQFRF